MYRVELKVYTLILQNKFALVQNKSVTAMIWKKSSLYNNHLCLEGFEDQSDFLKGDNCWQQTALNLLTLFLIVRFCKPVMIIQQGTFTLKFSSTLAYHSTIQWFKSITFVIQIITKTGVITLWKYLGRDNMYSPHSKIVIKTLSTCDPSSAGVYVYELFQINQRGVFSSFIWKTFRGPKK